MLSVLPVEILLEIIRYLPPASITSLSVLSKSWATFMVTNESSVYHTISKQHGYVSEGSLDITAPPQGWKAWFIGKFQIEFRWIGKLPGKLYRVVVPGKMGSFHRIKIDEEAGYVINTFTDGGLVVSDIHDHRILWSLDEDFCASFVHCEHDNGYIVFNRTDNYKEVWRRRIDTLHIPRGAWPSGPHNEPDGNMTLGNRIAEDRYLDVTRSGDPDHLRGQFIPWARLLVPEDGRAFKLTGKTLLVSSNEKAFLFDVEEAELQQTIQLGDFNGRLRYVDVNEQHIFIVSTLQLNVYDRGIGSCVLSIPAGRQPWDYYANPENQWRRTAESFNHGELGFKRAAPPNWGPRDDYFHAAHVSSCGKHLAIKTLSNRVILIQDFWRLLPKSSSSATSAIALKDISKQVDFYIDRPSLDREGYLAYDRGKVAVMGVDGIYVLTLNSVLDQLEEIKSLPKDIHLRTAQQTSGNKSSWPNLRLREVEFDDPEMFRTAIFSCLQLSETKLYFSMLSDDFSDDWDDNMWCYDFASSPSSADANPPVEEGSDEDDWDTAGRWDVEKDCGECDLDEGDDWVETEARLVGDSPRTGRR